MVEITIKTNRDGISTHLKNISKRGVVVLPMQYKDKKIVYMKAPRTGGSSVHNTLKRNGVKGIGNVRWLETITDEELKKYFIFSFVRNPWDRLMSVSAYFMYKPKYFLTGYRSDKLLDKNARRHALPCSLFTHKDGEQFVDTIFRYENLQEHFDLLCDYLGIDRVTLPHLSKSKKRNKYKYFIGGELDLGVREFYKDDIKLLGYTFGEGE